MVFRRDRVDKMMLGEMITFLLELDDTTFVRSLDNGRGCTGYDLDEEVIWSFVRIGTRTKHRETMRTMERMTRPIFGLKEPDTESLEA